MKKEVELSCQKDTIELQRPAANKIVTKLWCKRFNITKAKRLNVG